MKNRLFPLFAFFVIASLLISGCALEHHGLPLIITTPNNGTVFGQNEIIRIGITSGLTVPDQYRQFQIEIYDNGVRVRVNYYGRGTTMVREADPTPYTTGTHDLYARARAYNSDTDYGEWYPSYHVCVFVGPNPPSNFTCDVSYGFPQHLEISTETPSIYTIITGTPPVTPLIIIRPENNNNNGGNGGASGGATGCAAYSDKNSCDLAGCSWNGSSCTVTP